MLAVRRNEILRDGCVVGFYRQHVSEDVTLAQVTPLFDSECSALLRQLNLPKVFKYIWISDIAIKPAWRRKGIASEIINSYADGALIACAMGSGSLGRMRMRHQNRIAFYESLGFSVVLGLKHDYAFRYGKKKEA